jgi:RHS repeat-associated protein
VNYPNGQQTTYGYGTAAQDFRLAQIRNLGVPPAPGAAAETLSQFDYTYDLAGRITTWAQRDSGQPAGRAWTFGYDAADQLTSGSLKDLANNGILKTLGYQYDFAGNRTKVTDDGVANEVVANDYNQTFHGADQGWIEIRGEVSERADVRIDGQPVEHVAALDGGSGTGAFKFRALVHANKGGNTYQLRGTELNPPPNSKIQTFNRTLQVNVSAFGPSGYDANGNQLNNGRGQIYDWDAENRLVAIRYGGTNRKTSFAYDGLSRRVRTEEWDGNQLVEGHTSLWLGSSIAEERDFNNVVQTRQFAQGEQRVSGANPGNYYYTTDHLGSLREMTDAAGVARARYDYDPYGNRSRAGGDLEADKGFTGFDVHAGSGLQLALYRAYDCKQGRWLSRDPIEEEGGINLYGYVGADPINNLDPLGLCGWLDSTWDALKTGYGYWLLANPHILGSMALVSGVNDWVTQNMGDPAALMGVAVELSAASFDVETAAATVPKFANTLNLIEEFLGGEGKIITNGDGDTILMRGDKKIRFDIKDPHGDDPHFHLEQQTPTGKWTDASGQHRHYFSK